MRITEYAWSQGWQYEKVLTGSDLAARMEGREVYYYKDADEVMLWFKSSKADQAKFGTARNHYRTSNEICAVKSLAYVQKFFSQRFHGAEQAMP
eukprot:6242467-Amphidinium_carterae.1